MPVGERGSMVRMEGSEVASEVRGKQRVRDGRGLVSRRGVADGVVGDHVVA